MVGYFDTALDFQDLSVGMPTSTPRRDGKYDVTFHHRPPPAPGPSPSSAPSTTGRADAQPMTGPDENGEFTTTIPLEEGRVEYKFVLDGKVYRHDPGKFPAGGVLSQQRD